MSVTAFVCPDDASKRTSRFKVYPYPFRTDRLDVTVDLICECECEKPEYAVSIDYPQEVLILHFKLKGTESRAMYKYCVPIYTHLKIVSKYDQEIPQSQTADNPWHYEEEPLNHHETPGRQIKQSNQLSLPHQDGCNTRMDIK